MIRSAVYGTILAAVALTGCAVLGNQALCYNPPASGDPMQNPKTHGTIAIKAMNVLQGDGKGSVAAFYTTDDLRNLVKGTREADVGGGSFSVAGQTVDKNSFTHFYNPSTQKGFVLDFGEFNFIKNAVSYLSLAPWKYFTLKGPHPSMADMADWYYARAVQEMRKSNRAKAMEYLGYVLHYISDATVPQHVADEGAQKPGSQHVEYENHCDAAVTAVNFPHAASGGKYKPNSIIPGDYVKEAAVLTKPQLANAKDPNKFSNASRNSVPLAEQYCAGMLKRFHDLWQTENFRMVVVTIDRLKAVSYSIPGRALDWPDQADFYAYVTIDGRQYKTGVVDGCDDMRPNSFIPYAWVFPKWIPAGKSSIQIKIAVWDDDGVTGDDKAYICPKKNEQELWVNYDLNTGKVTGDASANASGLKTAVHAKGNHSSGDEAEIWFTVERLP